jgi:hypothetical protein
MGKLAQVTTTPQHINPLARIFEVSSLSDSMIPASSHGWANSSRITCCNVQMAISAQVWPRSPLSILLPPRLRTCVSRRFAFSFFLISISSRCSLTCIAVGCKCRLEGEGKPVSSAPIPPPPLLPDHGQIPLDSELGVFGKLRGLP